MKYHIIATITSLVWGSTLVSSKVLLNAGMTPAEIMTCRFTLAYILMWLLYPRTHKIESWHDEFFFFLSGLFGGTLYFLTENTALYYTQSTNVALICATTPIATAIASHLLVKGERFTLSFLVSSTIAFIGVALVILNGTFVLKLNPKGDLLAIAACLCWALYCISLKMLRKKYDTIYATRNTFFYGILTMVPFHLFYDPFNFPLEGFTSPVVWGNLCFLGLVASGLCYFFFNLAIKHLGVITSNKYIYLLPIVTIIIASIVLDEQITKYTILGTVLIIGGLWGNSLLKLKLKSKK